MATQRRLKQEQALAELWWETFMTAVRSNDTKRVRKLMNRVDMDVIRLLMNDPRVDPSAEDNAALEYARDNGRRDIMELLYTDPRVDEKASMMVDLFVDDGIVHAHTKKMNELLLGINTNHIYIRDRLRDLANYSDAYHNTDEHDHVFDLPEDESLRLLPRDTTERPFTFLGQPVVYEPNSDYLGKKSNKKRVHKPRQSKKRKSKKLTRRSH